MKKKYSLVEAAMNIQAYYNRALSKIEFEDGSGRSFNFRFVGESRDRYINMDLLEVVAKY